MSNTGKALSRRRPTARLLAFVMALLLMLSVMPENTFAYIGAFRAKSTDSDKKLHTGTFEYDGDTYMYIENEYLHFDICVDGKKHKDYAGVMCHTIPTAQMDGYKDLNSFGRQKMHYQIKANKIAYMGNFGDFDHPGTVADYSLKGKRKDTFVSDKNEQPGNDYFFGDSIGDECISLTAGLNSEDTKNYNVITYFTLVEMDKGSVKDGVMQEPTLVDPGDKTQNWGVVARSICSKYNDIDYSDPGLGHISEFGDVYRLSVEYLDFPKMGHPGVDVTIPAVYAQKVTDKYENFEFTLEVNSVNIVAGIGMTKENQVSEIYSDSYTYASPFVAASNQYWFGCEEFNDPTDINNYSGVEGHPRRGYAQKIKYDNYTLWTYGHFDDNYAMQKGSRDDSHALWGYRDLLTKQQIADAAKEGKPIEPDKVTATGKDYLYVKSDGTGFQVAKTNSASKIPSDALAFYNGEFKRDDYGNYHFTGGSVYLSPTIYMSWDASKEKENGGDIDVYLKSNGELVFPADQVNLNSPSFKFFSPKTYDDPAQKPAGAALKYGGYAKDQTRKGLVLEIDPEQNDAILNVNLPGNGVSVEEAAINKDGELVFSGSLQLELFLANVDMQRLSYKNKNGGFKVNGIEAKGELKTLSGENDFRILNFSGTNISADISTFENEHYNFELTLSVKDMFTTEAELSIVRLNNGKLCPDNLYFNVNIEADGVGLDITPATPVVTITGGGGGVYNLADTVQGNYLSIPPVVVRITGDGKILKVMEGKLDLYAGPGRLSLESHDLGFKYPGTKTRIDILDELSAGYYLKDALVTYWGTKYQGYEFGGNMALGIAVIPKERANTAAKKMFVDTVKARAELGANVIVAENHQVNKAYARLGVSGGAEASVKIPLIDYELVKGKLQFNLAGEGIYPRNGNPFENMQPTGGIAATGQLGKIAYGRVIFYLPDKFETQSGWGTAEDFSFENLSAEGEEEILSALSGMAMEGEPELVTLEDGSEMVAVYATNMYPIDAQVQEVAAAAAGSDEDMLSAEGDADPEELISAEGYKTKQITIDKNNVKDGQGVILAVVPDDSSLVPVSGNSVSANSVSGNSIFTEGINVSGLNGWTKVTPEYDAQGYISNNTDLTMWEGIYTYDDNGEPVKSATFISVLKDELPSSGTITITADHDFTIAASATAPITELTGSLNADNLALSVANPVTGQAYQLQTFYGSLDEEGNITPDHLVDSRQVTGTGETAISTTVSLPTSGQEVPSGTYYVTSILTDINGMPIASYDGPQITYSNTAIPDSPSAASLARIGNEDLRGSWSKVEDKADAPVDGYRLKIYQKDGTEMTDTGRGYDLTKEELATLTDEDPDNDAFGLYYDSANHTYSIDMALTMGGNATENGETDANLAGLEAGKEYCLGVSAYTNREVAVDENNPDDVVTTSVYGAETLSAPQLVTEYVPVEFTVSLGSELLAKSADKTYSYKGKIPDGSTLWVGSMMTPGGTDVTDSTNVTVTCIGLTDDNGDPLVLHGNAPNQVELPDFDGVLQLEVKAAYSHDGVVDESTEYVSFEKDNLAPALQFDKEMFYTDGVDDEGHRTYTITGVTEAGADIYQLRDYQSQDVDLKATADADGRFEIIGTFENTVSGNDIRGACDAMMVSLFATDEAGNDSETVTVALTAPVENLIDTPVEVTQKNGTAGKALAAPVCKVNGDIIDASTFTFTYSGVLANGSAYRSTMVPTQAGRYTVTVSGKDDVRNYTGTSAEFVIQKAIRPTVTVGGPFQYTGASITPEVTVRDGNNIIPKSEYTVSYFDNVNVGTAGAIVKAAANGIYTFADVSAAFTIAKQGEEVTKPADKGTTITDTKVKAKVVVTSKEGQTPTVEYKGTTDTKAKSVTIPSTIKNGSITYKVTSVAPKAFANNKKVTSITVGKNVTTIGDNAFAGCSNLKTLTVGADVSKLGANFAKGCKKMKKLHIKTKKLTLSKTHKKAFKGLSKNTVVYVPKAKRKTYTTMFRKRGLPKNIKIKGK